MIKMYKFKVFRYLVYFSAIFLIYSCGGSGNSNEKNISSVPEDIVSLNVKIFDTNIGTVESLTVYGVNGDILANYKTNNSSLSIELEKQIIEENIILILEAKTNNNKILYGVYIYNPDKKEVEISKDTTTAYLISKYSNDLNYDSYKEFLLGLKDGVYYVNDLYRYKQIFISFLPIVEQYLTGNAEYPTREAFLSIIPDKVVEISQEELKSDKIERLVKYGNDVLKMSFRVEDVNNQDSSLSVQVVDKKDIEFLGETFSIYKIDTGNNVLKDFSLSKVENTDNNEIKATLFEDRFNYCGKDDIISIEKIENTLWVIDTVLSNKICQAINWDKTGFDYSSNKFKLVFHSTSDSIKIENNLVDKLVSLITIPGYDNFYDEGDNKVYTYEVDYNTFFELKIYLVFEDPNPLNSVKIQVLVFKLNSLNDILVTKAKESIIAYKTLRETRASPENNNADNHWNNFVDSSEYKGSITTDEVITHRIVDFDKVLGKGINTTWDKTAYAKKVKDFEYNDNRIPLLLIHGWQGDKDLRNPAKIGLWENSELKYFQHFLDYYLSNENLQNTYHIYLYHYTTYKHITYNAYILKQLLNEIKNKFSDSPLAKGLSDSSIGIVIIGHSMGGLIARSLIEEHEGLGQYAEYLRKLITLDTPHHGSVVAENFFPNNVPKDLGTHGAFDLNWDNYDSAYDDSLINDNNYDNRWSGDSSVQLFDINYLDKLEELVDKNKKQTANPYLLYLNSVFKENFSKFKDKYIFYVAWNVHSFDGSIDDIFSECGFAKTVLYSEKDYNFWESKDFIDNGCMDASTIKIGSKITDNRPYSYSAGGAEPVGSAFLTLSDMDGDFFDPYRSDINETIELVNKLKITNNLISIQGFNIDSPHPLGISYRLFWDYDHEKIVNGAYLGEKGIWDKYLETDGNEGTAFKDFTTRIKYINAALEYYYKDSNKKITFDENTDPNEININPLKFEPVFLVLAKDLYDIAGTIASNLPVIINFKANENVGNVGDSITFGYEVSDPDGDILTCEFDFNGDGNVDKIVDNCTTGTESYAYPNEGTYYAKLTVIDSTNLSSSTTVQITVQLSSSNEVVISDSNLESCIRQTLGIDETTTITKDLLLTITSLYCYEQGITDISPLSNLINLQKLVISYNQITDISPLSNLANLQYLIISYNCITDFTPVSFVPNCVGCTINEQSQSCINQ
ncbi:leucine-rich repeat domain-containing protein [Persephonella sp.]